MTAGVLMDLEADRNEGSTFLVCVHVGDEAVEGVGGVAFGGEGLERHWPGGPKLGMVVMP